MVDLVSVGFTIDIEITNRCNAKCYFCPRDATPHQGVMSPEVFEQSLARAVEFQQLAVGTQIPFVKVSLCGLGEPLLNRHAPDFVRQVTDAGLECMISSNGSLLDEARGAALLEAGLEGVLINVGEQGDDYEDIYKLPWEKTRDNVLRFAEMAGDDCSIIIVLVDHRRDSAHTAEMRRFWTDHGLDRFVEFGIMNRGGTLVVDHMQYASYPEHAEAAAVLTADGPLPRCVAPFMFQFIGYDGRYYLCCSDWKKEVPLGTVFDRSFQDVMGEKWAHVTSREPICASCNLDPVNRLTDDMRVAAHGAGPAVDTEQFVRDWRQVDETIVALTEQFARKTAAAPAGGLSKRRIPVVAS